MNTDKTDSELVRARLEEMVDLWCLLNTPTSDKSANEAMRVINQFINKDVLLKRWNQLQPITKDPEEKIPFHDDPVYMARRKQIISKLLTNGNT